MVKIFRVILAVVSFVAVTLLFVDFTGTARELWPWMAKIQFMPAVLSANAVALLILLAMTLLLGRVYCSVICPLGILQDIANWLRGAVMTKKRGKLRFAYTHAHTRLRLGVLTAFVALVILGLTQLLAASIAGLIEPYSAYGRIASQIFSPVWDFCNNLLAGWSESQPDNYTFARVAYSVSIPVLSVAIITLVVVMAMAWRGGRDYCNTICPVGTILGYLSKFSLLKIEINEDKCRACGLCARACKAKCIDTKNHTVDYTRCVACMDCIGTCRDNAISYTWRRKASAPAPTQETADAGRRGFVSAVGLLAGAAAVQAATKTDGGLTALKAKQPAKRAVQVVPAGARGLGHLSQHCTACQLCVQACPQGVLKPRLSLDGFMQPALDFTDGYCHPECTACSDVCPTGAFERIDEAEKSSTKVGNAVVDPSICLSAQGKASCGSCAAHCPAGAIEMVETADGHKRPAVDESACIGCGACEYYCPVGTVASMTEPGSAIHVEGLARHHIL